MSEHPAMWNIIFKKLRTAAAFLFVLSSSLAAGISLSPCGTDGFWEIPANEKSNFTCTAEGPVQWRLRTETSDPIGAYSEGKWTSVKTFGGLFTPVGVDAHQSVLIINPVNNTKLYENFQLVNGSLECVDSRYDENLFARCGLNYIYLPEEVSCIAVIMEWYAKVSCDIGRVYSSRKLYTCQLIRIADVLQNQTLNDSVFMVTSQTSEKVADGEVKVKGSCQLNTSLPAVEGRYKFYVSIFPGGRTFAVAGKGFAVERPASPSIMCGPQPFVLENTDVTCSCSTTSLGWPAGSLRWVKGDFPSQRKSTIITQEQDFTLRELQYTLTLSEPDHNKVWLRCDIVWGTEVIEGQLYIASVGYAASTPELSVNGKKGNHTVTEGEHIQLVCKSDGRPTPNLTISNNNNTVIRKYNSSPANYTFIARCEDPATYTCSAWNEFWSQSAVTSSLGLNLDVACKPRNVSSTIHLGNVMFRNKSKVVNFDVIAYPTPSGYAVWAERPEVQNEHSYEKVETSEMHVTCTADTEKRYLSRCSLTVFGIHSRSTGWYKVQIINQHGDENFTVVISYGEEDKEEELQENHLVVFGSVAAVILLFITIAALIVVNRNRKNGRMGLATTFVTEGQLRTFMQARPEVDSFHSEDECFGTSDENTDEEEMDDEKISRIDH